MRNNLILLSPGGGERKEMDRDLVERNLDRMKRDKETGKSPRELRPNIDDNVKVKRTEGIFSEPVASKEFDGTSDKLVDGRNRP